MRSLATIALLLTGQAAAQTPGFWLMGYAPGTDRSFVSALSQDGSVAAGYCTPPPFTGAQSPGFTWTASAGRYDFGLEPGTPSGSYAYGLSSDGNTVVGVMGGPGPDRPYRKVGNAPLQDLGSLGYSRHFAKGVSGDGSVVIGYGFTDAGHGIIYAQAFRWTEQTGIQGLGWLPPDPGIYSAATAVSRDGTTIVGQGHPAGEAAFMWRAETGMQALPQRTLGDSTYAEAVNADGSVIVGSSGDYAARWTSAGVQSLGTVPGWWYSHAYATDDSGTIIGGAAVSGQPEAAMVWTAPTGAMLLSDYLASFGVTIPIGWTPQEIHAISGDGLTFAGYAISTSGGLQGFVATVPEPPGEVLVLSPTLLLLRRRRRA